MKHTFKYISIYFDEKEDLIGVPSTKIKKWNALADIDKILNLKAPYSDDQFERFIKDVYNLCYTYTPHELPKQSALQKYLGVKTHSASVKGRGLVALKWLDKQGYEIIPTWKDAKLKNAFVFLEDRSLTVPIDYKEGELARRLRSVMSMSPIGSMNWKPK
ncbi:MAG: hypothetical protein LBS21_10115 [Clostridiales bacterium]|jgi:hypothetical protein|nr:hypothetical protein [Clostridiales bacterium]